MTVDSKQLGLRLRQAREHRRMSQEDLAAAIAKDQKAISEYESGRRKLAVIDLALIASALQLPITYFFEEDIDLQSLDDALLHYFHQFPSTEERQGVLDILRILTQVIRQNPR